MSDDIRHRKRRVHAPGAGGANGEAQLFFQADVLRGPNWAQCEIAATGWAHIMQHLIHAIRTIGALITADARLAAIWR